MLTILLRESQGNPTKNTRVQDGDRLQLDHESIRFYRDTRYMCWKEGKIGVLISVRSKETMITTLTLIEALSGMTIKVIKIGETSFDPPVRWNTQVDACFSAVQSEEAVWFVFCRDD